MKKQILIILSSFFGITTLAQNLITQDTITICGQNSYTLNAPSPNAFNVWKKNGEEEVVISSSMTFRTSGWYHLYTSNPGVNDVAVCQLFNNANSYTASLNVPNGYQITSLQIALWGTPVINCSNPTAGTCNLNVTSILNRSFLGKTNMQYFAGQFPDPCVGVQKTLYSKYVCSPYIHDSVYVNILSTNYSQNIQDVFSCDETVQSIALEQLQCDTSYQLIQTLNQPVNNTTQSTLSLEKGQLYRLKVTNTVSFGGGLQGYDGFYYIGPPTSVYNFWRFNGYQPGSQPLYRPTPDLYNPNHTYYFYFLSDGTPQNIGAYDCCLGDNSGSLTFAVEKVIINQNCGLNYVVNGNSISGNNAEILPSNQINTIAISNGNASCILDSFYVFPPSLASLDLGPDTSVVCSSTLILNASNQAAINYSWNTGESSSSIMVDTSGFYIVDVLDTNNCTASDSIFVLFSISNPSAGPDQTICKGDTSVLSGSGAVSYAWNNNIIDGQAFIPVATAEYIVTGTDANGCIGTDSVVVTVNNHTSSTQTQIALESYTWPVNGQTYTQSGLYYDTLTNAAGCDSVITLDLTLSFTGIDQIQLNASKKLLKITDLNGKETPFRKNTVLLFIYEDGTVERAYVSE